MSFLLNLFLAVPVSSTMGLPLRWVYYTFRFYCGSFADLASLGEPGAGQGSAWLTSTAPAGLLVDQSRIYSRAFYSCAAGMLVAAVCLALVRPCKQGLCCRPRTREGKAGGPRGKKALQDIPEDFLDQVTFRSSIRNVGLLLRRCSGQGPHISMTGEPRGFS